MSRRAHNHVKQEERGKGAVRGRSGMISNVQGLFQWQSDGEAGYSINMAWENIAFYEEVKLVLSKLKRCLEVCLLSKSFDYNSEIKKALYVSEYHFVFVLR